MGTITKNSFMTALIVVSASLAIGGQGAGRDGCEAATAVGCMDGHCEFARSAGRLPAQSAFLESAQYAYHQYHKPVIHGVNFIDLSGKKRDLRKKPEENGFDPKLFSPMGTIVPNQDIIDPNLANWKDHNNPPIIKRSDYAYTGTSFMVSPCHILASYHIVFGDAVDPDYSKFSATVTVTSPVDGEQMSMVARPVIAGNLNVSNPKQREDWVLLETKTCPSLSSGVGWYDLEEVDDTRENIEANIAGWYGDKRAEGLLTQDQCKLRYYHTEQGWSHTCASSGMASGAPIFVMRNGVPKVVAMNWGAFKERPGILDGKDENDFNGAVGINAIIRAIKPYIAPRIRGFYTKYPNAENPLVGRHAAR